MMARAHPARVLRVAAVCAVLLLGLLSGQDVQAQEGGWRIAADMTCLWRSCATFQPNDGTPELIQSWRSPLSLTQPGRLHFPAGYTRLERPSTQQVLIVGPGNVLYQGGSAFHALQGLYLKYEHAAQAPAPLEILLPTLILGTEGTRFELESESSRQLRIAVEDGRVLLGWIDAPLATRIPLEPGQVLTASSLEPRSFSISQGGTRGVPTGSRGLSSRGLTQALTRVEAQFEQALETGRLQLNDDDLTLLGAEILPRWAPERRLLAANALALGRPDDPVAGRVVFQLWVQARELNPEGEDTEALAQRLNDAFAQTAWPAAVEGMLVLEASRSQAGSPEEPTP